MMLINIFLISTLVNSKSLKLNNTFLSTINKFDTSSSYFHTHYYLPLFDTFTYYKPIFSVKPKLSHALHIKTGESHIFTSGNFTLKLINALNLYKIIKKAQLH